MKRLIATTTCCMALVYCTGTMAQSDAKLLYGDRSPRTNEGQIHILDAVYGQDERLCNARDKVANRCNDRQACRIDADNHLCGNPYGNVRKDFFVAYDCGDGRRTLTVSEGEQANIYCLQEDRHEDGYGQPSQPPRNWRRSRIYMARALYGVDSSSCEATQHFAESCNEQNSCRVKIDNSLCGDPARGRQKAAEITYWCNGELQQLQVREKGTATLNCR